jgi:hypothetical protein
MKINRQMSALLQRFGLKWPLTGAITKEVSPSLVLAEGCVLLKRDYEGNRHVKITDFPDKTGFEHFINHVHFPFTQTKESLLSSLGYAESLRKSLLPLAEDRRLRVFLSISQDDRSPKFTCTVSFYTIRQGEILITDDLEEYESEAILVFDVPEPEE